MNVESYEFLSLGGVAYSFMSIGKRRIPKVIIYSKLSLPEQPEIGEFSDCDFYNLGFGDLSLKRPELPPDDKVVSDNGDYMRVFNTVLNTIPRFFAEFPDAGLVVTGSDNLTEGRRIRIYRHFVNKNITWIQEDYHLIGVSRSPNQIKYRNPFMGNFHAETYVKLKDYDGIIVFQKKSVI